MTGFVDMIHGAVFSITGRFLSEEEKRLAKILEKSYKTTRVIGRGTITTDVHEVITHPSTKKLFEKADALMNSIK